MSVIIGNGNQRISVGNAWEKVAVNHIQRIMQENVSLKQALQTWSSGLTDLQRYLESSKFHQDTTVQVQDVFLRLQEAKSAVNDVLVQSGIDINL